MYSSSQRKRNGKRSGQVAVKGAVTSPPPKFTGVLDCLKAARIIENICRIERPVMGRSFFCTDNYEDYMYVENLDHMTYNYGILIIRTY